MVGLFKESKMKEFLLENKIVMITGCDRGIGYEMCKLFALQEGATVYANILHEDSADKISSLSTNIVPVCFNVTDKKEVLSAVQKIKKECGRLDVLINNAGVISDSLFDKITEDAIDFTFDVNIKGLIFVTQAALKLMRRNDAGGSIINMSSIIGLKGNPGQAVYGASKAAVANITKTLAQELASRHIRVNAIAPGSIDTAMFSGYDEKTKRETIESIGMKRLGKPEEVAKVALFLASDMSSYVTGTIIGVNGGIFR